MKTNQLQRAVIVSPVIVWILAFVLIPMTFIVVFSLLTRSVYGGVELPLTLQPYLTLLKSVYWRITLNTFIISALATVVVLFLAFPTAYLMARSRYKVFWLFLMIIPFWTNFLIRIYAWIAILGTNGVVNQILQLVGITNTINLLYNPVTVVIVLACTHLPFAVLPLFAVIEKFDFSLLEAARDLGATRFASIRKVLIPGVQAGIFSAILFTFIPAFGAFAVPQLVGGRTSFMLGNLIARELTVTRNWPLACAISTILTGITMVGVFLYMKTQTKQKGEQLL